MNYLTKYGTAVEFGEEYPVFLDEVTGEFLTYDPDGTLGELCPCVDSEGSWEIGGGLPLSERV